MGEPSSFRPNSAIATSSTWSLPGIVRLEPVGAGGPQAAPTVTATTVRKMTENPCLARPLRVPPLSGCWERTRMLGCRLSWTFVCVWMLPCLSRVPLYNTQRLSNNTRQLPDASGASLCRYWIFTM